MEAKSWQKELIFPCDQMFPKSEELDRQKKQVFEVVFGYIGLFERFTPKIVSFSAMDLFQVRFLIQWAFFKSISAKRGVSGGVFPLRPNVPQIRGVRPTKEAGFRSNFRVLRPFRAIYTESSKFRPRTSFKSVLVQWAFLKSISGKRGVSGGVFPLRPNVPQIRGVRPAKEAGF